jgi:hypothetical protein
MLLNRQGQSRLKNSRIVSCKKQGPLIFQANVALQKKLDLMHKIYDKTLSTSQKFRTTYTHTPAIDTFPFLRKSS